MEDKENKLGEKIDTIQQCIRNVDGLLTKFQEFNSVKQHHVKRQDVDFMKSFDTIQQLNKKLFILNPSIDISSQFKSKKLHADSSLINSLIKNLIEFSNDNLNEGQETMQLKFDLKKDNDTFILSYKDDCKPLENCDLLQLFYQDVEIKKPNLHDGFRLAIIDDVADRQKWKASVTSNKSGNSFKIVIPKKDVL